MKETRKRLQFRGCRSRSPISHDASVRCPALVQYRSTHMLHLIQFQPICAFSAHSFCKERTEKNYSEAEAGKQGGLNEHSGGLELWFMAPQRVLLVPLAAP